MNFPHIPAAPFLLAYREEAELEPLPGRFDAVSDVWTISVDGVDVPMVLHDPVRCSTETITRVRAETTDED